MIRKIFGRKPPGTPPPSPPDQESVSLSMQDMVPYCTAMARRRGYPADSLDMIAYRVRFLEQRGLPGFAAFAREMLAHRDETLAERASSQRKNGARGGACPFVTGISIGNDIDRYLTLAPGQAGMMPAPSHPMLLLPKLAQLAGPRGVIITAQWLKGGESVAATLVDGHRLAHFGPLDPLFMSEEVAICRFAEETTPLPAPLRAAHVDSIDISIGMMGRIAHYIETGQ